MSIVNASGESRVVLENVPWSTYVSLAEDTHGLRGRMTYDRGTLEIMSPSKSHENIGRMIGRMIEAYTEEKQIEIVSVASLTVKLEKKDRGFEAEEAYYIGSADAVRGKDELDFTIDPAPDLVIEVDISRTSIGKQSIFKAFNVAEYWQYHGNTLRLFVLRDDEYQLAVASSVLPGFPLDQLVQTIESRSSTGETQLIRRFRAWLREQP